VRVISLVVPMVRSISNVNSAFADSPNTPSISSSNPTDAVTPNVVVVSEVICVPVDVPNDVSDAS